MKKNVSKIFLPAAALVVGLGLAGSYAAHAATNSTATGPMSSLVTAIAQKFNLNSGDVQQVFDQQHAQMQVQHQQKFADRITQAVTDGKLTQDQADKIIAKQKELQVQQKDNMSSMVGKTEAERRASMEQHMTEIKQWATDNNIPLEYLMFSGHGGQRGGQGPEKFQR